MGTALSTQKSTVWGKGREVLTLQVGGDGELGAASPNLLASLGLRVAWQQGTPMMKQLLSFLPFTAQG